jgi:UDP-N-acetylmuramate--alanine ligase
VPGAHNCLNALAVIGIALELGVSFDVIKEGLSSFEGVQRRFHIRGEERGIVVADDYGHHPTEIKKTLQAIRNGFPDKRIVAVFQPHRYTRTKTLFNDFVSSFDDAPRVYITEIYPASEDPIVDVSGSRVYEGIRAHGHGNVFYVEDKAQIPGVLIKDIKRQDLVIFLGAGDIWRQGVRLLELLK